MLTENVKVLQPLALSLIFFAHRGKLRVLRLGRLGVRGEQKADVLRLVAVSGPVQRQVPILCRAAAVLSTGTTGRGRKPGRGGGKEGGGGSEVN